MNVSEAQQEFIELAVFVGAMPAIFIVTWSNDLPKALDALQLAGFQPIEEVRAWIFEHEETWKYIREHWSGFKTTLWRAAD